jgi:AcrR family transcriptional regulator
MASEPKAEIIEATNRALCQHGYAGLTMQRIAAESSMTSAAIHYHFDTKEELLIGFLDHLIERVESKLACEAADPRDRLEEFLDTVFDPSRPDADAFPVALMELKTQAPHQDRFRERFLDLDATIRDVVAGIVADGIEAGHFEAVDPDAIARLVTTTIDGAHIRGVALGERAPETRRVLEETLELYLGWTPGSGREVVS